MLRSTRLAIFLGLLVGLAVPAVTSADVWSIKSDCEEGDWSVTVTLDGLGAVDVSCLDGAKTEYDNLVTTRTRMLDRPLGRIEELRGAGQLPDQGGEQES